MNQSSPRDTECPSISLEISVRDELNNLPPLSSLSCIYRVPDAMRRVNAEAYTPEFVSIGPIHHGKECLKYMEERKKRYLNEFLGRSEVTLDDYIKTIRNQEDKLRNCYAETIDLTSDEFIKIILVDAAFTIEFLLTLQFPKCREGHRITNRPRMILFLVKDMVILDNQLPFFILEDLFALHKTKVSSTDNIIDYATLSMIDISERFIDISSRAPIKISQWKRISDNASSNKVEHFVSLVRLLYIPLPSGSDGAGEIETANVPSLTALHHAGVKFQVRSTNYLVDIKFADGILHIPKMIITRFVIWTFGNLIAFEQYHCISEHYINDYVILMRNLVSTPKDVALLVDCGILECRDTECEPSREFFKLAAQALSHTRSYYYSKLCKDLNKYHRSSWKKWKAELRQKYFNTPWTSMSVIAAVVLLILTTIQTVCSIISVT